MEPQPKKVKLEVPLDLEFDRKEPGEPKDVKADPSEDVLKAEVFAESHVKADGNEKEETPDGPDGNNPDGENPDGEPSADNGEIAAIQLLLMEAVEGLSIIARTIERWPIFTPSVGTAAEQRALEEKSFNEAVSRAKVRIADHMRRLVRKMRRLIDAASSARCLDHSNVPLDLIEHIDSFLSPNLWLRGLFDELQYLNDIARGELEALGAMHASLKRYMAILDELEAGRKVLVPDFTLATAPPTKLRPAVSRTMRSVNLTHVLSMLPKPLKPLELGADLEIRKRKKR